MNSRTKRSAGLGILVLIGAAVVLLAASVQTEKKPSEFLKGRVHYLNEGNLSLVKKMKLAETEFRQLKAGDSYFTGYVFLTSREIHMGVIETRKGEIWKSSIPFRVTVDENEIKVRRKYKSNFTSQSLDSEEGQEPVGLLLLHRISKGKSEIQDARMIDLDQTFEFEEQPLYWLGEADNEESFRFLESEFEAGDLSLQKTLLSAICSHDNPKAHDLLRRIVFGNYAREVRKNAIFWLGNIRDAKSLGYLKEIFKKENNTELKKQAVFAIQLSNEKEAVTELIQIAKNDRNQEIRKNAIFWLGQKASKECVKVLKDVVQGDEDVELKNHAVFAISRLPKDQSVPMLIDNAKTNKSSEVRKKAIFWLGQTGDERALKFFEEILFKK
ncbi:MAG: HEAT repeat domain-containing protein [Candidatus Aminicenantes bacterium]|nr:MAG: HEAT repeat domain-containing protein [Candidatus Aminicenantes bacterium]